MRIKTFIYEGLYNIEGTQYKYMIIYPVKSGSSGITYTNKKPRGLKAGKF